METALKRHDAILSGMSDAQRLIWNNQKELSRSAELLDEQFAVIGRMTITSLNVIFATLGVEDRIGEKEIEKVFKDWAEFKRRGDFRSLMLEWMTGVPIESLPPEVKQTTAGDDNAKGNNGNENAGQERPTDGEQNQGNDVPAVQNQDGVSPQP